MYSQVSHSSKRLDGYSYASLIDDEVFYSTINVVFEFSLIVNGTALVTDS